MRVIVYPHAMDIGGSQLNAVELAGAVRDRGHDVLVVSEPGPLVETVRRLGIEHIEIPPCRRRPSPAMTRLLVRTVRRRRVDLVHGYEWPPAIEAFLGPRLCLGVPTVATVLSMAVAPFLPRRMPLMVGTEQIRDEAIAGGHGDVTLQEPPVDVHTNAAGQGGAGFRAQHRLDPTIPLAVVVSRLARELKLEGLLSACDAVASLAADEVPFQLAVVGDGPARLEVARRAAEVNAAAGRRLVVLTGLLSDPRPAYDAADVVLGMGGSALRGMAFGKPLVVQGENGFWRLLTPETSGQFLRSGWFGLGGGGADELRSELLRVLADPIRSAELGRYGRSLVVERYSLEHGAAVLEEAYEAAREGAARDLRVVGDAARTLTLVSRHVASRKLARRRGADVPADDFNAMATPSARVPASQSLTSRRRAT